MMLLQPERHAQDAADLATAARSVADQAADLAQQAAIATSATPIPPVPVEAGLPFIVTGLTVFVLACFVGYYVVWRVTPALHSPLMAVTNAVSSVIIVGALIATAAGTFGISSIFGFLAVILASVNIFGGFLVTQRMLAMYKKKMPAAGAAAKKG